MDDHDLYYPNDFWHNFDPHNVLLAIATNIPIRLVTCDPRSHDVSAHATHLTVSAKQPLRNKEKLHSRIVEDFSGAFRHYF